MSKRIVIIGGVAAGATAAAKARREDETAEITIFEKGPFISYANCGLPYYLGGEIKERSKLLLQTPESLWKRYRVKVNVNHEVMEIERSRKVVKVKDLKNDTIFDFPYDKLIISPGAGAIIPPLPGIKSLNIFTVKTVPDVDNIKKYIDSNEVNKVTIIGAGFIGLETAEAMKNIGKEVTIIEQQKQVLPPFDEDIAIIMQHHIEQMGINIIIGDGVSGFHGDNNIANEVELQSGKRVKSDLIILSIGVRPEITIARNAGLEIGVTGGIVVNEYQQTSDPDIYAAGDAVEVKNLITGKPSRFPLAGPANKQGRIAGHNSVRGNTIKYPGGIGTSIIQFMGCTAGITGLTERYCNMNDINIISTIVHPFNHVTYYPGSNGIIHIKLISNKLNGQIIGSQIIGEIGVDKRIDVIATAISGKMRLEDIENLDLSYSPQYGSANDPIVIAAFSSLDNLRGNVNLISYNELMNEIKSDINNKLLIIDVRTISEYNDGHIDGSINIPVDEIRDRLNDIDKSRDIIVYCKIGMRGYIASRILYQYGYHVRNIKGGYLSVIN